MATQSTSRGRSATASARRPQSAGRKPAAGGNRFGRAPQQPSGRFGRSVSMPSAGRGRPSTSSSRGLPMMQRKGKGKQQSGAAGLLGALGSALPTSGGKAAARGGKKPAGFAVAAAAAGMAFKNRDKLMGMLGRGKRQEDPQIPSQPQPTPPAV